MQKKIKRSKLKKKEKNKSKNIILFFLIVIILLGILVGSSLSKYQTKISGKAYAQIAKPILEVRREESLLVTALAPKATYVFDVLNYKEDELNEVDMEYYIEIITHPDEAIKFDLYQGETQIPLIQNKTKNIKLEKGEKQIHSYRLEIIYDKTKDDKSKDINQNVEIKIHSIQKI